MNSAIILAIVATAAALWLFLVIVAWIERRHFLRLEDGPHKSCVRLAEQLDKSWRVNRSRERQA